MLYFSISAMLVCAAFCALGLLKSDNVRSAADYAVAGRKAGPLAVTGIMMGSLVAGGSTIGTAQLAYVWGASACWFTLGCGLGCAILGLCFAKPVRRLGLSTLPTLMEMNYGYPVMLLTMAGSILGTIFSVATQFQAGAALIQTVFPMSYVQTVFLISTLILGFIFFGGLKSFSVLGNAKAIMIYVTLLLCCAQLALRGQTISTLLRDLPVSPWFNPFAMGVPRALSSCFSLIAGALCTQIYMQAIFAAYDEEAARKGCLTAAVLIPPLGVLAIWIGIAARNSGIVVEPSQVLPHYLMNYFHPLLGGALWAGLAIAVVGGASGLCLGIATNISLDILRRLFRWQEDDKKLLAASRYSVLLVVAVSAAFGLLLKSVYILELSYIGMGLRSSGMIVLFVAAVLKPGFIRHGQAMAISSAGLATMFGSWLLFPQTEPLFAGILASLAALALGRFWQYIRRGIDIIDNP